VLICGCKTNLAPLQSENQVQMPENTKITSMVNSDNFVKANGGCILPCILGLDFHYDGLGDVENFLRSYENRVFTNISIYDNGLVADLKFEGDNYGFPMILYDFDKSLISFYYMAGDLTTDLPNSIVDYLAIEKILSHLGNPDKIITYPIYSTANKEDGSERYLSKFGIHLLWYEQQMIVSSEQVTNNGCLQYDPATMLRFDIVHLKNSEIFSNVEKQYLFIKDELNYDFPVKGELISSLVANEYSKIGFPNIQNCDYSQTIR
jgi:hypothetical protein